MTIPSASLSYRLTILRDIMLRNDLNAAELRLCWFLLTVRMNETNGACYSSNVKLSSDLGMNPRTLHRAKQHLKKIRVLDWTIVPTDNKTSTCCSYRFKEGLGGQQTSRQTVNLSLVNTPLVNTPVANKPVVNRPLPRTHGPMPDGRFFVEYDTPQWDYWDNFLRKTTGIGAMRGNRGRGLPFPSEWPQEPVQ